ncbi:hypothetical protein [Ewingella americana]|uniref:Uncharacterized protein n=1 Tax=Ewingella americana TaxID=41202 RepID=A0A502GCV4_9GAMM|nr:hypothetical protein [Ewingella americana]TPG59919.1 hypothetical protein EAH77_15240 [Ewingella americana]
MDINLVMLMQKCIAHINGTAKQFQLMSINKADADILMTKNYFGFTAQILSRDFPTQEVHVEIHHQTYRSLSNDQRHIGNKLTPQTPSYWIMTPKPELKTLYTGQLGGCCIPELSSLLEEATPATDVTATIKKSLTISSLIAAIEIAVGSAGGAMSLEVACQNIMARLNLALSGQMFADVMKEEFLTSDMQIGTCTLTCNRPDIFGATVLRGTLYRSGKYLEEVGVKLIGGEEYLNDIFVVTSLTDDSPLLIWDDTENEIVVMEDSIASAPKLTQVDRIMDAIAVLEEPETLSLMKYWMPPNFQLFYRALNWLSSALSNSKISASIKEDYADSFPAPSIGDRVEFKSDLQIEQGPCSGTVTQVMDDSIEVSVSDVVVTLPWPLTIFEQHDDLWIFE